MIESSLYNADFFHVLYQIIKLDNINLDLTHTAQKKLSIKPCINMRFPVRDVLEVITDPDEITVVCQFMGLYGVDSPLPMYFNEMCLRNDEFGQALRGFLDVFNHRNYALYFLSWLCFYPEKAIEVGKTDYFDFIKHFSGDQVCSSTLPLANCVGQSNASSLYTIINYLIPDAPVKITDFIPKWTKLVGSFLGEKMQYLGDNTLLGCAMYDCSNIHIEIGPVAFERALLICSNQALNATFKTLVAANLESVTDFEVYVLARVQKDSLILGESSIALGHQLWLGGWLDDCYPLKMM